MLAVDIPGFADLRLEHLVLDFNGTLAVDGELVPGVATLVRELSPVLQIHVVTADTFGSAVQQLSDLPVRLVVLGTANQADAKLDLIDKLGRQRVVAIGNGRNDRKMLAAAGLGLCVLQGEGTAGEAVAAADAITCGILDALELLIHPLRLTATLRA